MSNAPATVQYPLREKRRKANRSAFIESARELFAERGFSRTTMEEIAHVADLHVQTLYRHFPTKNELSTAIEIETFRRVVDDRPRDILSFWRDHVGKSAQAVVTRDGGAYFLHYVRNEPRDPKLTAARADQRRESQEIIAQAIEEDFDLDGLNEHLPILVANLLWGGNVKAIEAWSEHKDDDLVQSVVAMASQVTDIAREQLGLTTKRLRKKDRT